MYSTDNNLERDREQIDILDGKILKLLNDRAKLSVDIARIKSQKKMPIFLPEREDELLEKIIAQNNGPFDTEAIRNIFINIMDESKRLQNFVLVESDNDKLNDE